MRLVGDHVKADVERLKEPDDHGSGKDNGKGLGDEVLGLIPCQHHRRLDARQAVIGQLHDKRHRVALKCRAVEYQSRDTANRNADQIERDHGGNRRLWEKRPAQQTIDRQLGRAAHERREHDRHLAVVLGWERTGRHDSRHGAAKTDEHGHKAAARQAKATQHLIHDKGHARHVSGVFQNGEEQKEHDDNRQEGQHAAHTRKHAVDSQRAHHVVGAERLEARIGRGDDGSDTVLHESLQRRADHAKRQPKDEAHDHQKRRNGCVTTCQDAVNLDGAHVLAALVRLDDATPAHVADKAKTHIGQRR